jgi:hypothetical protein
MAENPPEERKKSRWRTKFFDKVNTSDDSLSRSVEQQLNVDDDVMDFLKPSTDRAQPRAPRIDVAAAPRWPGASDLPAGSPGVPSARGGSFRSGRKRNVTVSFVATAPEVIGEGGDESEEPSIEVSVRRKAAGVSAAPPKTSQDDGVLGRQTPAGAGGPKWTMADAAEAALKRSKTTQTHNHPHQFSRTGTGGLDQNQLEARAFAPPSRRTTDDADFAPNPIKRTQTGFSNVDATEERATRIPELIQEYDSENSPIDPQENLDQMLETGPSNPNSFSSRVQHKMRAEEGKALHDAVRNRESLMIEEDSSRPSTAGSTSRPQNRSAEYLPQPRRSNSLTRSRQPSINAPLSASSSQGYPPPAPAPAQSSRLAPTSPNDFPPDQGGQFSRRPSAARSDYDMNIQPSPIVPSPQPSPAVPGSSGADAILEDFAARVTHMQGIFRLTAELEGQLYDHMPMKWLRAAIWWFLRGRAGIETLIRGRPRGEPIQELLTQPHVDLAKTWWILFEVFPSHPSLSRFGEGGFRVQAGMARDQGDQASAEAYDVAEIVTGNLKALLASMSRNHAMPPQSSLVQGQDQTIWIKYPNFAPDVQAVLGGQSRSLTVDSHGPSLNPLTLMPLMDTPQEFSFGRMFVQASLSTEEADTDRVPIPCVLSITRPTADFQVKLAICSETELVNIVVQSDRRVGPTWEDVQWKTRSRGMYIRLPRGFTLSIELTEKDYRTLWGIDDYTRRIEASLQPGQDERMVFEVAVQEFQYSDSGERPAFPPERVRRCRARVFEKVLIRKEGPGQRRFHRGYRLLICTSPKNKTLSSVSHQFGVGHPMNFEYRTDAIAGEAAPALVLRMKEENRKSSMNLVFKHESERNQLYCVLNGMVMSKEEGPMIHVPLANLSIEAAEQAEGFVQSGHTVMSRFQWNDVRVINYAPRGPGDHPRTVMSDCLRILARHNAGSVTDRLNIGPGELSIRLSVSGEPEISILRSAQEDIAMSVDAKRIEPGAADALDELLATVNREASIRTLHFRNLPELHAFQTAITGFTVLYDG